MFLGGKTGTAVVIDLWGETKKWKTSLLLWGGEFITFRLYSIGHVIVMSRNHIFSIFMFPCIHACMCIQVKMFVGGLVSMHHTCNATSMHVVCAVV
jgi:hypothetical protein